MNTYRYVVTGRVQGVGFRYFTQRLAAGLGLAGFVRNRLDGGVEVVAVGPEEVLGELERALWQGPPFARVDRLERSPAELETVGPSFRIEV